MVVRYDVEKWSEMDLCRRIRSLDDDALPDDVDALPIGEDADAPDTSNPLKELVLTSGAIACSYVGGPLAAVAPGLLAAGGRSMFRRCAYALTKRKSVNVDVLDTAAVALLAVQGQWGTAFFMTWLVNLADYIRTATMERSRGAIRDVFSSSDRRAWVVRAETKERVPVDEITLDDTVVVYSGERIPVDGEVLSGTALIDEKAITGESMPVEKSEGAEVFAATVVTEGKVYVRPERIGSETEAARIVKLVQGSPLRDTKIQNYAEKWADEFVPYSLMAAGAAGLISGNLGRASSLLIIDYGTGIRVAAPTTVLSAMARAAREGVLIKGGRHLERLAEIDAIVFDKTGTLTAGRPEVADITPYNGIGDGDAVLSLAAAAEQRLNHPVSEAVVRAARSKGLHIPERQSSDYAIGMGVEACVGRARVLVGSRQFMLRHEIDLPDDVERERVRIEESAMSPLFVACDAEIAGTLGLADPIRPESADAIEALRSRGVKRFVMLTGDRPAAARRVADQLGLSDVVAEAFPEDKVKAVEALKREGYTVAVIGDGINDSPALARADVGIAVKGGTDVARETAHVILLQDSLQKVPLAIDVARASTDLIRQNWRIISTPNTAALALCLIGAIGPIGATIISNGCAVVAAGNALRPLWDANFVSRRAV